MDTRVKICGVANAADAEAVAALKPDFMGFIFWPGSKRFVTPADVREWISKIPASVKKVGVFVDATPDEVKRIVDAARLDIAQLHGAEDSEKYRGVASSIWHVVKIPPGPFEISNLKSQIPTIGKNAGANFQTLEETASVDALLIDTYNPTSPGGTGETGDWVAARKFVEASPKPVLLAGGLTAENVAEAIRIVRPWGVDVSSGVEERPAKKDLQKVKDFIHAARNY